MHDASPAAEPSTSTQFNSSKRRGRRFRSFIFIVDFIGVAGGVAAVEGFWLQLLPLGSSGSSFLQNFGVEVLGAWISVRLLEWVIRRRDEAESARTRVLRHTRFWLNQFRQLRGVASLRDIERLEHEISYTRYMKGRWAAFLTQSEVDLFNAIVSALEEALPLARETVHSRDRLWRHVHRSEVIGRTLLQDLITEPSAERGLVYRHWLQLHASIQEQIRLADGHIHSFETCRLDREEAKLTAANLCPEVMAFDEATVAEVFELSERILDTKEKFYRAVDHIADQLALLEADIREETPEGWI